jgi:mannan endo-1,4-beta-mannosidase
MKSVLSLVILGCAASCVSASVIEKRNSNSWAGSNHYYLHALHPEEQATYINALKSYGTKVVRLWDKCLPLLT